MARQETYRWRRGMPATPAACPRARGRGPIYWRCRLCLLDRDGRRRSRVIPRLFSPAEKGGVAGCRTGASPLLLPPTAAVTAGKQAAGTAAHDHGRHRHRHERFRWPWQHTGERDGAAGSSAAAAAAAAAATAVAASAPPSVRGQHLKLDGSNNFLPPTSVLERSEFLTPLDADTLLLYRWLLQP